MWTIGQCAFLYVLLARYVNAEYDYQPPNYQYSNQATLQRGNYAQHVSYTSEDYYNNYDENSQAVNNLQYNDPLYNQHLNSQEYSLLNHKVTNYNNNYQQVSTYYNPEITNSGLEIQNVEPVVKKHIYFHVPPPDLETQTNRVTVTPQKKSYKIIFIKLPSQESRNSVYLQNQLNNLQSKIEEKTLIYVLVKKPEVYTSHLVQPKTVHSSPEVFYVKYKHAGNDLDDIAQQINYELAGPSEVEEEILQPGSLVNDQTYV